MDNLDNQQVLRTLIDSMPDFMNYKDHRGRWLFANAYALELYGLSGISYVGKTDRELSLNSEFYREALLACEVSDQDVWAKGKPIRVQEYVPRRDGSTLVFDVIKVPIYEENGQPKSLLVIGRDITRWRHDQRLLLESREQYQSLLKHNLDGILHISKEGFILSVNAACTRMLGYCEDELIGRNYKELLLPESTESSAIRHRIVLNGQPVNGESKVLHKDGHQIDVELKKIPVIVDNQVISFFSVFKDVTHENQLQVEVTALRKRNDLILQSAGEGIIGLDDKGIIIFSNPAASRKTGYTAEELLGQEIHPLLHHSRRDGTPYPAEECEIASAQKMGRAFVARKDTIWRKDGSSFIADCTTSPITEDGAIKGAVLVFRDITSITQAEELLVRNEKLSVVGELAAGIAHEVRNPLTALSGFMQLLRETSGDKEKSYLDIMKAELGRIEQIVNEFLLMAKPTAIHLENQSVSTILFEILSLFESQATMRSISISITCAPGIPEVRVDKNRLKQVFINILKNGIEAMEANQNMHIVVEATEDEEVSIQFIDQGRGIPEEDLQKIGDPFYTTKNTGTGLGLLVSKKIIAAHGGRIQIFSTVGEGTTVDVRLPTAESLPANMDFNGTSIY